MPLWGFSAVSYYPTWWGCLSNKKDNMIGLFVVFYVRDFSVAQEGRGADVFLTELWNG